MSLTIPRRRFVQSSLAAAAGVAFAPSLAKAQAKKGDLALASFEFDVSPPKGHSLCGGWITPVEDYDDRLQAIGLVLLGADEPIVLCAVDWTGILNSGHLAWREALAEAAGTSPDRVAVHCVHQHNAPFACPDAQAIVGQYAELPHIVDMEFFGECLSRAKHAVKESLTRKQPLTHIATGQGKVEKVASNRRILGPDGKVQHWRGSKSSNPLHKELPEGLIDPWLKTVAFYNGEKKIAACHYYATHPMSYYGDGRVSSDFTGLARKRRQKEEPECRHLYFTGGSGNIAAGKYNDGSKQARIDLTQRVYDGMVASEQDLQRKPIESLDWTTTEVMPPARSSFDADQIAKEIADSSNPVVARNRPSYTLAWLRRCEKKQPILLTSLHVNETSLVHLPAESFLEYQLHAQQTAPERFVATAAYGDGGPWYIPTEEAYPQGGYEVRVAFCDPPVDPLLCGGIDQLLGKA